MALTRALFILTPHPRKRSIEGAGGWSMSYSISAAVVNVSCPVRQQGRYLVYRELESNQLLVSCEDLNGHIQNKRTTRPYKAFEVMNVGIWT